MDRKTFDALMLTQPPIIQRLVKEVLATFRPPPDDDRRPRRRRQGPRPPRPAPNIKGAVDRIMSEALAAVDLEKVQGR
jgi:hypothetical protein